MQIKRKERTKIRVPRSVQDTIPIRKIYDDGIFETERGVFSKTFKFTDINYMVSTDAERVSNFEQYIAILNSFDSKAHTQLTINKRSLSKEEFAKLISIHNEDETLKELADEYNKILYDKAATYNSIVKDKYFTVSINKKNIEEARAYFNRSFAEFSSKFSKIGSRCTELSVEERLRILYDFYRKGEESNFNFNINDRKMGKYFKDVICPDYMEVKTDYFQIGRRYGRALFLKDYASSVFDNIVDKFSSLDCNMMLSIDSVPLQTSEAVKLIEKIALGVETDIANWQKKQNANNNFSALIPYEFELKRDNTRALDEAIRTQNERLFISTLTVVITADNIHELERDTDSIKKIAQDESCQFGVLGFQQLDGIKTVLPLGLNKLYTNRMLQTKSLAAFIPFSMQEVQHKNGVFFGNNRITKSMLFIDRDELKNGNALIFGMSGGGKSVTGKWNILSAMLGTDADVIIIDPEREYSALATALGGETIDISASSKTHINALEISKGYGDDIEDIIITKSEFVMSLCSQVLDKIPPEARSIIDRCLKNVLGKYAQEGFVGDAPTLKDLRDNLLEQHNSDADRIATALELYVSGSLNTFSKQTNVDTNNRLVVYDINKLSDEFMSFGMLVVLDSILNRITKNKAEGRNTYLFIDEMYLMFSNDYSAKFLFRLWKRVRKYGGYCTGITQNVSDVLNNQTGLAMLNNSEIVILLGQSSSDIDTVANTLKLSEEQTKYFTNADKGCGALKVGEFFIPFDNRIPKNTGIYKLLTTKINEE